MPVPTCGEGPLLRAGPLQPSGIDGSGGRLPRLGGPRGGRTARDRYSCFDHVRGEGPEYGHAVALDLMVPCENEVVAQLVDLRQSGGSAPVRGTAGWPRTSSSMPNRTPGSCTTPSSTTGPCTAAGCRRGTCATGTWRARWRRWSVISTDWSAEAKVVVWEHNSHVGDARATELGASRRVQRRAAGPRSTGPAIASWSASPPTTAAVTAASRVGWTDRAQACPPCAAGELRERCSTDTGVDRFCSYLSVRGPGRDARGRRGSSGPSASSTGPRPSGRATGSRLAWPSSSTPSIHIDRTSAVEPLERTALWDQGEPPETYPTGL